MAFQLIRQRTLSSSTQKGTGICPCLSPPYMTRWQNLRLLLSLCLVCVVGSAIVMMDAAALQQRVAAVPLAFLSIVSGESRTLQPLAGSLAESGSSDQPEWEAGESSESEPSTDPRFEMELPLPADGRSTVGATLTGSAAKRRVVAGKARGREGNWECRGGRTAASQKGCEPAEIVIRAEVRTS